MAGGKYHQLHAGLRANIGQHAVARRQGTANTSHKQDRVPAIAAGACKRPANQCAIPASHRPVSWRGLPENFSLLAGSIGPSSFQTSRPVDSHWPHVLRPGRCSCQQSHISALIIVMKGDHVADSEINSLIQSVQHAGLTDIWMA
jgi:hypothetical protein